MIDLEELPWVEYRKTWKEFKQENLNQIGVYIQYRYSDPDIENLPDDDLAVKPRNPFRLIGDMTNIGGQCNCCPALEDEDIVLRHCQLINLSK